MDLHAQQIFDQYLEHQEDYKIVESCVKKALKGFVTDLKMLVNSVDTRIKTSNSLKGKLELKGYKYNDINDITDIVGARVVTFYKDEVDKIAALVCEKFTIDWDNSVDKRRIYKVDQFGYMSLHYICSIPKEMYFDEKHPFVNECKFEIQLRTTLQHTWASIYHDTGYKNDVEVPEEYLRSLNRLAGLLELADEEFENIKQSINEYRRKVKKVVASGNFNDVDINGDTFKAYLETGPFDKLNQKIAETNNMEIEKADLNILMPLFKEFLFKTLGDIEKFIKENSDTAYKFVLRQIGTLDLDIISELAGPLALCTVFALKKNGGEFALKWILEMIYGERKSNVRNAHRLFQIGLEMGIVDNPALKEEGK